MALRVFADLFTTADMTGTSQYLTFSPGRNMSLKAVRTWLVMYNNPSFTNLTMKLYADRNGEPGKLKSSSLSFKSTVDLNLDDYTYVETFFEFPLPDLHETTDYHLVINCSGYTFSEGSFIAWAKAWPDPVYGNPSSPTFEGVAVQPYFLSVIGDEL